MLIYEHQSPQGSCKEIMFSLKPVSGGRENRLNTKWKQTFPRCGRCGFQFSLETEAILEHHPLFMAFIIYRLYLARVEQAENLLQMQLAPASSGWQQHTTQRHRPQGRRCKSHPQYWDRATTHQLYTYTTHSSSNARQYVPAPIPASHRHDPTMIKRFSSHLWQYKLQVPPSHHITCPQATK